MSLLIRILLLLYAAAVHAQAPPIRVAAVISQSGMLAPLAAEYRKGLELWRDELNAGGGLLGRHVELVLRDDASSAVRCAEVYRELIKGGQADLLIGPFGSAATLMAGAEAERAQRVLINGAGPSRAVHRRGTRYVFQTVVPNIAYGDGVAEVARAAGARRMFILARDDVTSREMAQAARAAALRQKLAAEEIVVYAAATDDFRLQIGQARAAGADAWIAFGGLRDAAAMIRSLRTLDYAPRLFFARSAADPKLLELVGQDAELSLGATAYEKRFPTTGNERFVAAFRARWAAPPDALAAQGFAAGTVLADAVRQAGSIDQEKLRATLTALETNTVLGGYKVDPESGAQLAAKPAVVQIVRGRAVVLWPEWLQAATFEPYQPWRERQLIE